MIINCVRLRIHRYSYLQILSLPSEVTEGGSYLVNKMLGSFGLISQKDTYLLTIWSSSSYVKISCVSYSYKVWKQTIYPVREWGVVKSYRHLSFQSHRQYHRWLAETQDVRYCMNVFMYYVIHIGVAINSYNFIVILWQPKEANEWMVSLW